MKLLSIDIVDPVSSSLDGNLPSFIPLLILIGTLLIVAFILGLVIYNKKEKKTFSTKRFLTTLLFISFFLSTLTFAYRYLSELKNQDEISKNDSNTLLYDVIKVQAKDILDGEIEDGRCLDTCEANLEITYNDDSVILNNVIFSHSIQSISYLSYNFFDTDSNYYVLRYGSGTESGTYVFNNKGYISKTFCSVDYATEPSVLLDNKNLLYNDCGVASATMELLGGISMIDLDTGKIIPVMEPIKGETETSYNLKSFDSTNNALTVEECSYPEEKPVCDEKVVDISDIIEKE